MLHVILKPPFDELLANPEAKCKCAHFEIGESANEVNIDLVESVWADGAELDLIMRSFEGIPKRFHRHADHDQTSKWFGDDAKFIVANWT
jgi:Zn-finger nucleic acid-binding protein